MKALRVILDILLILFGVFFMIGVFDPSPESFWLAFLLAIVGVFILSAANTSSYVAGAAILGIGVFLMLRSAHIITIPWFRYLVGAFLLALGIVNLLRNIGKEDVSLIDTFRKDDNK